MTKSVLFVLGMHRSGTSAVARALNLAGVPLPTHLWPQKPENPKGFWEPIEVTYINDALLEHLNCSWNSFRPIEANFVSLSDLGHLRKRAQAFLEQCLTDNESILLKDPRFV